VVGLAVYAEPLDAWVLIGAALVIAGNALNIVGEARRRDRA